MAPVGVVAVRRGVVRLFSVGGLAMRVAFVGRMVVRPFGVMIFAVSLVAMIGLAVDRIIDVVIVARRLFCMGGLAMVWLLVRLAVAPIVGVAGIRVGRVLVTVAGLVRMRRRSVVVAPQDEGGAGCASAAGSGGGGGGSIQAPTTDGGLSVSCW